MNNTEIASALRELANRVDGPATASPPIPPPVSMPPPVTFTYIDAPGGKRRIDNVAPEGTPGTAKLPVTGHVLSLPQPSALNAEGDPVGGGEMLMGYALRVGLQCGVTLQQAIDVHGAMVYMSSGLKTYGPTSAYWPIMVDEFYNREAYNPISDADKAAMAKAWADAQERMRNPPPAAPPPSNEPPPIIEG